MLVLLVVVLLVVVEGLVVVVPEVVLLVVVLEPPLEVLLVEAVVLGVDVVVVVLVLGLGVELLLLLTGLVGVAGLLVGGVLVDVAAAGAGASLARLTPLLANLIKFSTIVARGAL